VLLLRAVAELACRAAQPEADAITTNLRACQTTTSGGMHAHPTFSTLHMVVQYLWSAFSPGKECRRGLAPCQVGRPHPYRHCGSVAPLQHVPDLISGQRPPCLMFLTGSAQVLSCSCVMGPHVTIPGHTPRLVAPPYSQTSGVMDAPACTAVGLLRAA
jgi:hypothetical protein